MAGAAFPILLALIGLVVFFCYATARPKVTVAFFVFIMSVSAALAAHGIVMLMLEGPEKSWQGVVLICFGVTHLLATMVAYLLLCKGSDRKSSL